MARITFGTGLPGVNLYPPVAQPWESTMSTTDFQAIARAADDLGFDSISIPEHIVVPTEMVELMGSFWSHAMTAMAFVAGATTRLIVDSSVIVVPYHRPVVMAKAVSTLDLLSGGRLRLSIGVGHTEHEFEVLGVPYAQRGQVADEHLAAMIELWTNDRPSFHGKHVRFDDIAFEPKPVQQPHPPIIVGGNSKAAMRRAARHDGWFPWLITVDELAGCIDYVRSQPELEGRTRPFDIVMPVASPQVDEEHRPLEDGSGRATLPKGTQAMIDAVGRLEEIGVTRTVLPMPRARSLSEHLEGMHWIAEEVMPAFR